MRNVFVYFIVIAIVGWLALSDGDVVNGKSTKLVLKGFPDFGISSPPL